MKAAAIAMAVGTLLTVEQRDAHRAHLDHSSAAISADGRFVAFVTYSRLVPADADHSSDVYVLDRARQDVTLESADTGRFKGDTSYPAISGDGRYVAFECADIIALRDRKEGVTRIIAGRHPAITADGSRMLFTAGSLDSAAETDVNGKLSDIYSQDLPDGRPRRISVGLKGLEESTTASTHPAPSSDGRYVAFVSMLPFDGPRQRTTHIFLRDTQRNITTHIGAGWDPSLSGDGRLVAFVGLSKGLRHIFVADLETGTTRIITNGARRGLANGASDNPKVSADGRFVAFQSEASDLVASDDFNLLWDVFIFDRTAGTMTRVSGDPEEAWMEPSGGPVIDGRGSVVAFSSRHPTDALDKRNDFDLYVATVQTIALDLRYSERRVSRISRTGFKSGLFASASSR